MYNIIIIKYNKYMPNFSHQYISAIAVIAVSIFQLFHIEVTLDVVTSLITGVAGIWIAIKRYKQGDITLGGVKKY